MPHLRPRFLTSIVIALPAVAQAAAVDGRTLSAWWGLPFAGMLLSLALLPVLWGLFWARHYGKITAGWAAVLVLSLGAVLGVEPVAKSLLHMLLAEYLPFIVLLLALFTASGGIHLRGNLHGSPAVNTGLIGLGAVLASLMGTTGASMMLVRPLIRANDNRRHATHVFVFFIFVVSNIGGSLTPLGDPPLFLGFLEGVDFFWTLRHLWPTTLFSVAVLLALFYAIDAWHYRREGVLPVDPTPDSPRVVVEGKANILALAAIVGLVLASGIWKPGVAIEIAGTTLELQDLLRDIALVGVTVASVVLTPPVVRRANHFSWEPMQEVAKLFAGIFVTMLPVLAMLRAGGEGAFAVVAHAVTDADGRALPWAYFWLSGLLSSFLDNAPTYLVFFNLAGGDAQALMGPMAATLAAISAGSVFMGANSYIGNAPNFMVKAVVEHRGLKMPSFFGYMAWSCSILLPLFALVTFIWMR